MRKCEQEVTGSDQWGCSVWICSDDVVHVPLALYILSPPPNSTED